MGIKYYKGKEVPQDYNEAAKWFRLSAEQGDTVAQTSLGKMYYDGKGVKQDRVYAHMWWNIASSLGNKTSVKARDKFSKSMTQSQLREAQQLARACVQKNYKGC
jgi:TPR repeat protein